ncbi:MAG: MMPL family transporter [Planctomycetaceae bacterium]|nr:MMPL family transporter [Planctomycetaceae bacterium]
MNTKLQLLGRVTTRVATHPRKALALALMVVAISAVLALSSLTFKSDRSDLISPEAEFHRRYLEFCERFRETNELLILLESSDEPQLLAARDWLVDELNARETLFENTMVHSSLEAWRNSADASVGQRVTTLGQHYGLARAVQERPAQGTPLEVFLHAAQAEIEARASEEAITASRDAETPGGLDIASRVMGSMEQALQAIDFSFQRYFPEKQVENEDFWKSYLNPEARNSTVFTRGARTSEDVANLDQSDRASSSVSLDTQELVTVVPLQSGRNSGGEKYAENLRELELLLVAARQRFPETTLGVTGIPQLEHEEMARSQRDMAISSLVSFAGVVLLLLFGFRGFLMPLACCLTLACSMIWTLGYTTLAVGHLNILSMAFAAILVGLGIDFGIHLLSSYQGYRQQGVPRIRALGLASDTVGKGIITAAVTTAVAFLCAGLTDFPGVAELGLIAGGGVLLAAATTFLVFPAIVALMGAAADREVLAGSLGSRQGLMASALSAEPLRKFIAFRPAITLLILLGPILAISWQAWDWDEQGWECRVKYDANLLNMQPKHLPAVSTQQKLQAGHEADVLYAVTWYPSREQASRQAEQFRRLPTVGKVTELASQKQVDVSGQLPAEVVELLDATDRLAPPPGPSLPHNPARVGGMLEGVLGQLEHASGVQETQLRLQLDHFLDRYSLQPFEVQMRIMEATEQQLLRSLWSEIRLHVTELRKELAWHQEMSQILSARFHNDQGDWLVQIHPRFDIWDDRGLAEFVSEIREVDPQVTGTPIQNFEASRQLKNSYLNAALYAALAIVLVVMVDVTRVATIVKAWLLSALAVSCMLVTKIVAFDADLTQIHPLQPFLAFLGCVLLVSLLIERRQCVIGLLALLPPIVGAMLLLGLMSVFQLQFTPANLIALPLVMGIGIDDGVHVIHDFRRTRRRYHMSANTWRALVLTTLTSVIGFGSLSIASHRGLAGLGIVVVVGITSCLFASVVILPAVLSLLSGPRTSPVEEQEEVNVHRFPGSYRTHEQQTSKRWAA